MMGTESDLHNYQRAAVEHIIDHPYCGLFLEMGLGKTVSTLTAINYLIRCFGEVGHVLIVAPLRVAQTTWSTECGIWEHLHGLLLPLVGPSSNSLVSVVFSSQFGPNSSVDSSCDPTLS